MQIPTSVRLGSGTESSVRAIASTADVVAPDCADREGSVSNWVVIGYLGMKWRLFVNTHLHRRQGHIDAKHQRRRHRGPNHVLRCEQNTTSGHTNRPYGNKKKLTGRRVFHAPAAQLRSLRPVHAPPVRAQVAHVLPRALRRGAAKVTLEPTVIEPPGEGVHVRL